MELLVAMAAEPQAKLHQSALGGNAWARGICSHRAGEAGTMAAQWYPGAVSHASQCRGFLGHLQELANDSMLQTAGLLNYTIDFLSVHMGIILGHNPKAMYLIAKRGAPDLHKLRLPSGLCEFLGCCLQMDVDRRGSAQELLQWPLAKRWGDLRTIVFRGPWLQESGAESTAVLALYLLESIVL
ncbi:hypothetical protein TURU_010998 [Turdus rufiventris]|nr:hypothetical protein TURU_010998 [Turdus rufiventris]